MNMLSSTSEEVAYIQELVPTERLIGKNKGQNERTHALTLRRRYEDYDTTPKTE